LKNGAGSSTPFCFDTLAQLANVPARITLYELMRLSKSTRDALREALADAEVFVTRFLLLFTRKTAVIVAMPQNSFPTSLSPQKTCRSKGRMIDPVLHRVYQII